MPGQPRLWLPFGPGDCSPFSNCTQRDELISLITNFHFANDDYDNNMDCSHSSSSYVLLCRSFYNNYVETSSLPDQIIWIAILVCVVIIVCLSLNTVRLVKKVRQYENQRNTENEHNRNPPELTEMIPQ